MADDPFEDVLNLEDQFYQEGFQQGQEDGAKAGRIEGRALGLEKGYQKFLESGRLHGKAIVWANRLQGSQEKSPGSSHPYSSPRPEDTRSKEAQQKAQSTEGHPEAEQKRGPETLPSLPSNPRLEKNIAILFALTEPDSLSTDNTDEAVNDFDDRLKRAEGKAKVIEKMVGEVHKRDDVKPSSSPAGRHASLDV